MNARLLPVLALAACFAPEPLPECRVVSTSDFAKRTPYFARLERKAATSDCTERQRLSSMLIGAEQYRDGEETRVLLRPGRLVDIAQGRVFSSDGRPVPRTDASDPKQRKLDAIFTLPRKPSGAVCLATGSATAEQRFDEVTVTQADGGATTFPAYPARLQFSPLQVSAFPPGAAFFSEVVQTEGTCTASYELLAIHPAVACTRDEDCAGPNPDAGRLNGSGLDPGFKATCDLDAGYCMANFAVLLGRLPTF